MKPEQLFEYAEGRGYKIHENLILGVYEGYAFTVKAPFMTPAKLKTLNVSISTDEDSLVPVVKELKRRALPKKTKVAALKGLLWLTLRPGKKSDLAADIEAALSAAADTLKKENVPPPARCEICKQGAADAYALQKQEYKAVHKRCAEERSQNVIDDLKDRQRRGSYLRGSVGALLGTLVGAIPNFISIFFFEYVIGWLFTLIPLAGYAGYRLFRGKPNKPATAIILGFSLLQAFVLVIANFYATIVQVFEEWLPISDTLELYFDIFAADPKFWHPSLAGEIASAEISNILVIGLFVIIGIGISYAVISRTAAQEIKSELGVMDTLVDRTGKPLTASISAEDDGDAMI